MIFETWANFFLDISDGVDESLGLRAKIDLVPVGSLRAKIDLVPVGSSAQAYPEQSPQMATAPLTRGPSVSGRRQA